MSDYADFLASKVPTAPDAGFEVGDHAINPKLFGWQRDLVRWALQRGRAAMFADTGLGKTGMQLEWARHVHEKTGGDVLILTPLAVASQTVIEGVKFGVPVNVCAELDDVRPGINITNYQRLERFDPKAFAGVVLDESSVLKAFGGKTRWALNNAFADTPYKLCCTATPAPNQPSEIGTHAHFLGVMDHGEMLTRWFINDTSEARVLRLKRHGEPDFWRWVASWAVCVSKPSDLLSPSGEPYPNAGFDLPPLRVEEHVSRADYELQQKEQGAGGGKLFRLETGISATRLHAEMRRSAPGRARIAAELVVRDPNEAWVLWCNTNYEADEIRRRIPEAFEVRGSDSLESKERKLQAFSDSGIRVLITKPKIAGFGLNWQHCARMVFVGLSYSYEQMYQALRRSYRFGQTRPVVAHIVTSETESGVLETIKRKQKGHREMQEKMSRAMREVGINGGGSTVTRADVGPASSSKPPARGERWELHEGDSTEVLRGFDPDSIHLSLFSPPFSSLYSYTPSLRDMGNCRSDEEFYEHFGFLIGELLRVTVPGRLCVVHTKDLVRYRNQYGVGGLRDFTGEITRLFEDERFTMEDGTRWAYHSKVTVWKDPVREMQRTKSTGLLYKTFRGDASYCRVGCPEYLTAFRKWSPEADSPEPVVHTREEYPLEIWQRYASPVWDDIRQTDVLNARIAREDADEKHIAPLQLDLIRRCLEIWTNPGDLVLDPFAGLGSTGHEALLHGRRFVGVELKPAYHTQAIRNLKAAESASETGTLLDALEASV